MEVIRKWLRGYSRDEIAKDSGIGTGTVSGIILQCRRDDADFDLLRAVAVELRDRGLQVKDYAPLFRLKNLLEEKEVNIEISQNENLWTEFNKFEALIITLEVLCFKRGTSMDQFFERVGELYSLIDKLSISIVRLPEYLEDQKKEIFRLRSEIQDEVEKQGATMNLLREYRANMPQFRSAIDALEKVTKERDSCQSELDYVRQEYHQKVWESKEEEHGWYADPEEVEKAKTELGSEIGSDYYASKISNPGLKQIILDLYRRPGKYIKSIKGIIENYDLVHKQSTTQ
jgi:hypothetical protein